MRSDMLATPLTSNFRNTLNSFRGKKILSESTQHGFSLMVI